MTHEYRPRGTCSTRISFELDGDRVHNVRFTSGCDGNLQAVGRLVEGLTVSQINEKCSGIRCGFKSTSCADQLASAVSQAYDEEQKQKKA